MRTVFFQKLYAPLLFYVALVDEHSKIKRLESQLHAMVLHQNSKPTAGIHMHDDQRVALMDATESVDVPVDQLGLTATMRLTLHSHATCLPLVLLLMWIQTMPCLLP